VLIPVTLSFFLAQTLLFESIEGSKHQIQHFTCTEGGVCQDEGLMGT